MTSLPPLTLRADGGAGQSVRPTTALAGASGVWHWDVPGARLYGDARFAELHGLDRTAAETGLPTEAFFEAIHPDDRMRIRIAVAGVMHGADVFSKQFRVLSKEGGFRWVSARGSAERDADFKAIRFSGVLTDISELKRTEERLQVAQTAGGVGTFEYTSGFGTVDVSEQFCRLLGLTASDVLPVRTINATVVEEGRQLIGDETVGGGLVYDEFQIARADTGARRWIARRGEQRREEFGQGARFVGVIYDVTEFKEVESKLRSLTATLEERIEARTQERDRVWNLSRDLLFVAGRDGRFAAVNPAWEELLGFTPADLIGAPIASLIHEDDLAALQTRISASARGEPFGEYDCRVRARDGAFHWVSWTTTLSDDTIYGAGRDITQRRMLEDQLRQSQKMEAVGQLTGGLAHDFNNMLTGMLGGIDMAKRRLRDGRAHDVDRFLDAAVQSGQRAAALTHRLLAFSRRQSLDSQPVDVGALVRSMEDLLRRTLGEQIFLALDMRAELDRAVADANQLESAILNLAINARDAMPTGGRLTISAANVVLSEAEIAESDSASPGAYVEISVADTGFGMSPDVLNKVFDPFFTTKPLGQGTGLGLSMIYGFVQQSRGHIRVASREGEGTTIRLFLPRYEGDAALTGRQESAEAPSGSGQTILVIEDDASVRLLVMQVLEELGYRGIETADGRAAGPILNSGRQLDLLITDVGLPGLNGRQLAEMARQTRPGLPILFMTGYAEQAVDQAKFLDTGMEIITKPFAVDTLGERIAKILRRDN